MFSQHHRPDRQPSASNDNGRFADVRRNATSARAGVVSLAASKGAVTLSYVADGVMIITCDAAA